MLASVESLLGAHLEPILAPCWPRDEAQTNVYFDFGPCLKTLWSPILAASRQINAHPEPILASRRPYNEAQTKSKIEALVLKNGSQMLSEGDIGG